MVWKLYLKIRIDESDFKDMISKCSLEQMERKTTVRHGVEEHPTYVMVSNAAITKAWNPSASKRSVTTLPLPSPAVQNVHTFRFSSDLT